MNTFDFIKQEQERQANTVELIASENFVSDNVMAAVGSCLTNKYAEGYPGRRYYGGCSAVDGLETYCQQKWQEVFNTDYHVNVQPHSGTNANLAAYMAVLQPGDRVLSMSLESGGHLSHGMPLNASGKIYDFIWDSYCDWYIELTKPRLNGDDEEKKESAQRVLLYVLTEILKLLHPFMPFITEEIWQALPHEGEALMITEYPKYTEKLHFPVDEVNFGMVMEAIKAVRARRAEMNVPPSRKSHLIIVTDKAKAFTDGEKFICKLAYASEISVTDELPANTDGMVSVITDNARMFMPMAELVDLEQEKARMEKELANARKQLEGQIAKLANEKFVSRAPEAVVNTEREKKAKLEALIENLEESLKNLK